jgi:hypothetical protein
MVLRAGGIRPNATVPGEELRVCPVYVVAHPPSRRDVVVRVLVSEVDEDPK